MEYVGDIKQIFYARSYRMEGGRSDGMRLFDVNNSSGLEFGILPDRCMDIGYLRWNGINMGISQRSGL